MRIIDTHTHLYLDQFDTDRDETIARAISAGVARMLLPNIDSGSYQRMMNCVERYKGICFPMLGLHPTSVKPGYKEELNKIFSNFEESRFVAIGEIGIDLYWDKSHQAKQEDAFRWQLAFARDNNLPVVIHARDSFAEVFKVLEEFPQGAIKGVFHAFTGDIEEARKVCSIGFLLGIGGIVTFKNGKIDKVVEELGLDSIILETDSPYLAPVPYRGKRNESSYLTNIINHISQITGIEPSAVADKTTNNAEQLFKNID